MDTSTPIVCRECGKLKTIHPSGKCSVCRRKERKRFSVVEVVKELGVCPLCGQTVEGTIKHVRIKREDLK